jgi:hypothetical protein
MKIRYDPEAVHSVKLDELMVPIASGQALKKKPKKLFEQVEM